VEWVKSRNTKFYSQDPYRLRKDPNLSFEDVFKSVRLFLKILKRTRSLQTDETRPHSLCCRATRIPQELVPNDGAAVMHEGIADHGK
jgi:hypothetical protein